MSEKKKRSIRPEYLNDFKKNEGGEYEYVGKMYSCGYSNASAKKEVMLHLLLCILAAVLIVLAGCLKNTGMDGRLHILLAYAVSLVVTAISLPRAVMVVMKKGVVREYEYQRKYKRVPIYEAIAAVLCFISILGMFADHIAGSFLGDMKSSIVFSVIMALAGVALAVSSRLSGGFDWKAEQ